MTREKAINNILDNHPEAIFISTTGKISRELYELRIKRDENADDFYMMGSMGHAPAIAIGIAMSTKKEVVILNGDGAFLMRMGSAVKTLLHNNIHHYILNNNSYDSTGGQPTDFKEIVTFLDDTAIHCVTVEKGCRKNLSRIPIKPHEIIERVYEKIHSR